MSRRIALFAPLALICMLVLGVGSASASITPTLIHPATGSVQTGGIVRVAYTLPAAADFGSGTLTFTPTGNPISHQYGMYIYAANALTDDFTFPVANASTSDRFFSGGGVPLPDGFYTVIFDYTTGGGTVPHQLTNTNVRVKNSTTPPNLISPVADTNANSLSISYSLPDDLTPGSTALKIFELGGPLLCTLNLTDVAAATVRTFALNPSSLLSPSQVASHTGTCGALVDGSYEFVLAYQDAAGDPVAEDSAYPVTIDTVTQAPTLTSPASDSVNPTTVAIAYTLPEAPTTGTAALTFSGPSNSVVHLSESSAGAHGYSLNPSALFDAVKTLSVSGDPSLVNGLYTVTLSYNDALGNPSASSATATNVRVGPAPAVPGGGGDGGGVNTPPAKKCFTAVKPTAKSGKLKTGKKYSVKLSGKLAADLQSVVISAKAKGIKKLTFLVDGKKVTPQGKSITVKGRASLVTVTFKAGTKTKKLKIQLAQSAC